MSFPYEELVWREKNKCQSLVLETATNWRVCSFSGALELIRYIRAFSSVALRRHGAYAKDFSKGTRNT